MEYGVFEEYQVHFNRTVRIVVFQEVGEYFLELYWIFDFFV